MTKPRVAVVGAGISGLTAAYLLRRSHAVTLYEAGSRLGGHAHTHDVALGPHGTRSVDSGFIVHNDRTYPLLRRLFTDLGVDVRPTEMSMGIGCRGCGLEFAGGRGPSGLFAQRRRLADPRFLRMLVEVTRFQRQARRLLRSGRSDRLGAPCTSGASNECGASDSLTYGEFLARAGFSDYFVHHYAIPIVSCVWSCGAETALGYPAAYLFAFLDNHGFLRLADAPRWYTVVGGSRSYVDKIAAALSDVRADAKVTQVRRADGGVTVTDSSGSDERYDKVVIAVHGDDVLDLLTDPTVAEKTVFSAFTYTDNRTVLHRDETRLPVAAGARSSWNFTRESCDERPGLPQVTYWMNKLQGFPRDSPVLVSLNAEVDDEPRGVLAAMTYRHPVYTPASVAALRRLPEVTTASTAYAGAYQGWGFHEDGCRSGVAAAESFGGGW